MRGADASAAKVRVPRVNGGRSRTYALENMWYSIPQKAKFCKQKMLAKFRCSIINDFILPKIAICVNFFGGRALTLDFYLGKLDSRAN